MSTEARNWASAVGAAEPWAAAAWRQPLRSTSVLAQYQAALQGRAMAILPCFMAAGDPRLTAVLPGELSVIRQFWMSYSEDLRRLRRVTSVAGHLIERARASEAFLLGDEFAHVHLDDDCSLHVILPEPLRGAAIGDTRTVQLPAGPKLWEVIAIRYP